MLLVGLTTISVAHYSLKSYEKKQRDVDIFISTVKLPGIVRSVAFNENRFIEYKDYGSTLSFDLIPVDYMGFVYDK